MPGAQECLCSGRVVILAWKVHNRVPEHAVKLSWVEHPVTVPGAKNVQ